MAKHKRLSVDLPDWVEKTDNFCLHAVAEDAYLSRAMAKHYGADKNSSCTELLRAGEKSLKKMAEQTGDMKKRCSAGERASRKFWEAKVCARRVCG